MSENEGVLEMQPSGRWAVCRAGREPVEITAGERFRIEFAGKLQLTRIRLSLVIFNVDVAERICIAEILGWVALWQRVD
jgi:hypothetical protein